MAMAQGHGGDRDPLLQRRAAVTCQWQGSKAEAASLLRPEFDTPLLLSLDQRKAKSSPESGMGK